MISANVPNDIRKGIYRRDGFACALCGDPRNLQIHHVIPRGHGGGNSPCNLICVCRYCHAAAHGTYLVENFPVTQEDVEQYCVEYLSDMYAAAWSPFDTLDYSDAEDKRIAAQMIQDGCMYLGRDL